MLNIGVFFGSRSPEHDISIITAQLIIAGLKGLGHQVTPVYISKKGEWLIGEELGSIHMFTEPETLTPSKYGKYYLDLERSVGKLVFKKKGWMSKSVTVNLAFPALHGSYGEDGTIQGLFEMLNVPYVGCGVTASTIAMDKVLTKQLYQIYDIPTTKFVHFYKQDWNEHKSKIISQISQQLNWPVFVKPVHLGSSIGIAKVKNQDLKELEHRIEVALYYDDKVLVEEGVENLMDVTCCVIGNEHPRPSLLQESVFTKDLFDFKDKYLKAGGAQTGKAQNSIVIPARLNDQTAKAIQEAALKVFKALECSGIARVDFLFDQRRQQFFANEVNPLPGTLYHHLWKASGLELPDLLTELIRLAEEKHEQKKKINYTFESTVLKNLKAGKLRSNKLS